MSVSGINSVSSGMMVRPMASTQVQGVSSTPGETQNQPQRPEHENNMGHGPASTSYSGMSTEDFLNLKTASQNEQVGDNMSVVKLAMMLQILKQLEQMSQDITHAAFGGQ